MDAEETREFYDMYLTTALVSYGIAYKHATWFNNKIKFVFPNVKCDVYVLDMDNNVVKRRLSIDEIESSYTSGKLLYPPNFVDSIRRIKSMIIKKGRYGKK